ncbi:MAG TPA: hypothetical protein VFK94_06500 [Patescibacteria group bacterium]|nr:hypothetical protein [Patescibacteria group bacterium]
MAVERYTTYEPIAKELNELNARVKALNERLTSERERNLLRVIKDLVWLCERNNLQGNLLENGRKALLGEY